MPCCLLVDFSGYAVGYNQVMSELSRESIIEAARPFIEKGIKNPDELLDSNDPNAEKLWELHDAWVAQETDKIPELPLDDRIRASIALDTIWYDAGFTGIETLEEIVSDYLIGNTLSMADESHRRDLANEVNAKVHEVEVKIKEQDPSYEFWDPKLKLSDWNPSRDASVKDFYTDYAYNFGTEEDKVDEAANLYLRFHADTDINAVKKEMLQLSKSLARF